MARVKYTKENMLKTRQEFRRVLKEAMARRNPIDDLLELAVELHGYEQQYGMTSADFYPRYQRGEFDDDMMHATMKWAMAYDHFLLVKEQVESALLREAVWREDVFRYDNAPHHREVKSFPRHKHVGEKVEASDAPDLHDVLQEIDRYLESRRAPS